MTHQSDKRHVVVIGAGFGGVACVRKLARDPNLTVTLVDRRNHHLFQPLLYQVATSTLTAPLIARSVRSLFRNSPHVHIRYDRAEALDLNAKTVRFSSGKVLGYDSLVVAVGARTSYFGNDHWAPHVIPLKTLSHAFRIRQRVLRNLEIAERSHDESERRHLTTVAIVGGGPTGVELAGAFSDLIRRTMRKGFQHIDTATQRIVLLEGQDRLLGTYSESHSEYARHHLEQIGVEVRTGAMVSNITKVGYSSTSPFSSTSAAASACSSIGSGPTCMTNPARACSPHPPKPPRERMKHPHPKNRHHASKFATQKPPRCKK